MNELSENIAIVTSDEGARLLAGFMLRRCADRLRSESNAGIATVFLMPHERYAYLNSSIVREIARLGGDVDSFVPEIVARALREKFKGEGG